MQWLKDNLSPFVPKNWQQIVLWIVVSSLLITLSYFGILPNNAPIPAPPAPIFEPTDAEANGWQPNPEAVQAIKAELDFPVFGDTPAGKVDDPLPESVYMWQKYSKLFGRGPPSRDQGQIGSCVGNGTGTAIDRTLATQIVVANGSPDEYRMASAEVIYGGSRVQIGGGKIRGDGSVGAWAAQFAQKFGYAGQEQVAGYNLTNYSVSTCREFGARGVPAKLLEACKEHLIQDITEVRSWQEAKKALASGYGIAVCSNQGFSTQRDANGVCRPQGQWNHCMCLDGYTVIGGKEYGHIENSWGPKSASGPVGPGDPPTSGFWADSGTIGRMLGQNDSWAFSTVKGWPKREIDWFVQVRPIMPKIALPEVRHAMAF
jgi:hypothetical protein